jgi:hypothetical protein
MVEDALLTIRTYLNAIEAHYNDSEVKYEHFVMTSDGEALAYLSLMSCKVFHWKWLASSNQV